GEERLPVLRQCPEADPGTRLQRESPRAVRVGKEMIPQARRERVDRQEFEQDEERDVADQEELHRAEPRPPPAGEVLLAEAAGLEEQGSEAPPDARVGVCQLVQRVLEEGEQAQVRSPGAALAALGAVAAGQASAARGTRGTGPRGAGRGDR